MIDLIGKVFENLKVISFSHKDKYYLNYWNCECSCGNKVTVRENSLKCGSTKSCGCLHKFLNSQKRKNNTFITRDNYMVGIDEYGKEFYFDIEDYEKIKPYYWSVGYNGYVNTSSFKKKFSFHRFEMNAKDDDVIDHINHIEFDNRKSNLRFCTDHENVCNKRIAKNNKSGKTGVYKSKDKWRAVVFYNGKNIHLGTFDTFEEAVKARIAKEIELFGEFSPYYKKEDL